MLNKQELKQQACEAIDPRKQEIIGIAQDVLAHPEPGIMELRNPDRVAKTPRGSLRPIRFSRTSSSTRALAM